MPDTGITPLSSQVTTQIATEVKAEPYWRRVLIEFDIFMNVLLFNGHNDETISSHSARAATQGKWWGIVLSKFLDLFQKDHGAVAEAADVARADIVVNLEEQTGNLPKE